MKKLEIGMLALGLAALPGDAQAQSFPQSNPPVYVPVPNANDVPSLMDTWESAEQKNRQCEAGEARRVIKDTQQRLKDLGYEPMPVDGGWGPKTEEGLLRYQIDHNLANSNRMSGREMLTRSTLKSLDVTPARKCSCKAGYVLITDCEFVEQATMQAQPSKPIEFKPLEFRDWSLPDLDED